METERIHRTTSGDGTEIAGRVEGQGPPLVFVHGGLGNGDTSWRFLAPLLAERFTCYLMSLRGRGLSSPATFDHYSHEHLVQDVTAFAESVGEPVGLVGHSSGARYALEAAAQSGTVSALAIYEPALPELDDEIAARWREALEVVREADSEGDLVRGAQVFLEEVALANDEELAALAAEGVAELLAPGVPITLREADGVLTHRMLDGPLESISVPALLMRGTRTHPAYADAVAHVARRLPGCQVLEIEGAGHLGPQLAPDRVAAALTGFFAPAAARA